MVFSFGGEVIILFDDGEDGRENESRHPPLALVSIPALCSVLF